MSDGRPLPASTVWVTSAVCFTALALLFTSQVWIDYNYVGRPLSWGQALLVALIDWELWTILAPAVVRLSERVSFSRRRWRLALAVHLPGGIIVAAVKLATEGFIVSLVIGAGRGPFSFLKIHLTLLTYWGIVAATHVARHYRQARERELRSAQLETELARAQVEALKMQLHPHFLFNTLNTVSGLMRENVEAADVMLSKLRLHALIRDIKEKGGRIVGISAPSRASTLVNYVGLEESIVDYVCEIEGSLKIGKCMPGTLIPVVEESRMFADQPECAIIFSWHIADELAPKLRAKGYKGMLVTPLPVPRLL